MQKAAEEAKDAREAMNTDGMRAAADHVDKLWTSIDPAVRTALFTIRFAEQDAYPATLRSEVLAARDALLGAVEDGDPGSWTSSSSASGGSASRVVDCWRTAAIPLQW